MVVILILFTFYAHRLWPENNQNLPYQYMSYGVGCAENELDVLTGENITRRVDILFDCGDR